jgi:hypothetical protein
MASSRPAACAPALVEASETSERCSLPRCPHRAVVTLPLLVEGYDAVLPVCRGHADWLGAYVEEDANVRLVERLPEAAPGVDRVIPFDV